MNYKFLAAVCLTGLTALANTNWDKTDPKAWDKYYKGTPSAIEESKLTEEQLTALTKASPSLRNGLKTLMLPLTGMEAVPDLKALPKLTQLEIGNKQPIHIDPNNLPNSLKTLVLQNNSNNFQKQGVTVRGTQSY
jgi:hypothetical protein